MSLLTELDAFFTDHHDCGGLDAGVDGQIVWLACYRGARMARRVDEADDAADLELDARGTAECSRRLHLGSLQLSFAGSYCAGCSVIPRRMP